MWRTAVAENSGADEFLLTHPVWDVTDCNPDKTIWKGISTHTSRVGCDIAFAILINPVINFYSHIPCGMWLFFRTLSSTPSQFLLTHPVWDVTFVICHCPLSSWYFYSHIPCGMWRNRCHSSTGGYDFYSHIPCGMWPLRSNVSHKLLYISTHTSRVGCDVKAKAEEMGRTTISTHTSRVGCDGDNRGWISDTKYFYSHIPCGMWPLMPFSTSVAFSFLLTHPVWDVTRETK